MFSIWSLQRQSDGNPTALAAVAGWPAVLFLSKGECRLFGYIHISLARVADEKNLPKTEKDRRQDLPVLVDDANVE